MLLRVSCLGPVLRLFRFWGGGPVPLSPRLAWGRSPPCGQAYICVLALRAVAAARGRAGGGASRSGSRASGVGRPLTPDRLSLGRAAGARYPLAVGARGVGVGTRHQYPLRALLQAGFARSGGSTRAPGGGRRLPGCGAPRVGRSLTPHRPSLGRAAGARYPLAVGTGAVGVGTRHQPHSARSCRLALRAVGAARGRPRGVPLAWVWGVRVWALSHARPPVLGACGRGPLPTSCGCGGGGRGDPPPTPQRALLRAGFARCGGGTRAPRGGASCLGVGCPGLGALPRPTAPPLGVLQRDTPHDEQADHKAVNTIMYQPNCCRENDPTINRPHASRPTSDQPGMQGSKRERGPMGWRHHGAPRPPTTIPTDTTQRRNSTIIQPTNQPQRTSSDPRRPGRAQARPSQEA